jgi:hypothetical protein
VYLDAVSDVCSVTTSNEGGEMNYHAHIAEIARQREHELRGRQVRHDLREHRAHATATKNASRASTIASLLRTARAAFA